MSYADNIIKNTIANNYLNYLWEITFLEGLTLEKTNIQKPVIANYLNEKLYIVKDVTVNKKKLSAFFLKFFL